MRKLIVTALVFAACAIGVRAIRASAAENSNASVAGTWACATTGSAAVKDAAGATSWVPSNGAILAVLDGTGKFTSGKTTVNTGGMACSYTFTSGTYGISPDGTGTYTTMQKGDASNSPKCPAGATLHTMGFTTNNTFVGLSTDSGATASFFCNKAQ